MNYGYKTILAIDGEDDIVIDNCSYTYLREVNEKTGEVQSGILNGTIELMYLDYPKDNIWEWGIKYKLKSGSIKVMQTDEFKGSFIPFEEVKFKQGACVQMQMTYNRHGGMHFCTRLVITSHESVVGNTEDWVRKNWLLSDNI